jgi:transposase
LIVEEADRGALRSAVRAATSEQRAVTRARIVLRSAEGVPIERIATELGVAIMTVKLWRRRYAAAGIAGLADAPRPGHPPTYTREDRDRLVALTMGPPPDGTTHWSVRAMARRTGMSPSTVHRIWKELGYKPHRTETFKFSTDPALEAKIRDVVGLYLDPPEGAIVLSLDEKTQIQALDRTQPMLPMRPGQVERHTHDYTRHGTTCLFAALEVGTGQVTTDTRERHTGADFLAFMRRVAREYPTGELHVILDNVSTHKTAAVRAWLERHPRITFHFTPTSASWMNQVETWFGILTRQAIRRGSFGSVRELIAGIDAFTAQWNDGSSPFMWVKTADEILAKAVRKVATQQEGRSRMALLPSCPPASGPAARPGSAART